MKDSLLQMRFHGSVLSSTSVTANASSSVRSLPLGMTLSQSRYVTSHHQVNSASYPSLSRSRRDDSSSSSMACVVSELTRYVLDGDDLTSSVVDDKTLTTAGEVAMSSSDPCVMSAALQHQQLRAQVLCSLTLSCSQQLNTE